MISFIRFSYACLLVLLTSLYLNAQTITWQRTYGGTNIDYGYSIVQTPDEGFIAVGEKYVNFLPTTFFVRLSKHGDTIWTRSVPGNGATGVVALSDGNYLISGWSSEDAILKIDIHGSILWIRYNECGYLKASHDSGFFVLRGPRIKKYNNDGSVAWSYDYSPFLNSGDFLDYEITPDNGVLIIGERTDSVMNMNKIFLRISKEGSFISFGKFSSATQFSRVSITKDNMIGIVGYRGSLITLAKYDTTYNLQWEEAIDTIRIGTAEYINSMTLCEDNGFAIAGWFRTSDYTYYVRAIRTNSIGIVQWKRNFGFGDHDEGNCILQTRDSGFAVIGTRDNYNLGDIYIIKTDKNGYADPPVGVSNNHHATVNETAITQIYPNPFNGQTNIRLSLKQRSEVGLVIFDNSGRQVDFIDLGEMGEGNNVIAYTPSGLSSGIYFCKVVGRNFTNISKLVLLK